MKEKAIAMLAVVAICILALGACSAEQAASSATTASIPQDNSAALTNVGPIRSLGNAEFKNSFRTADGTIYLPNNFKTTDGGKTITTANGVDVEDRNSALSNPGLFYAADFPVDYVSPGVYKVNAWRSTDNLKTLKEEVATIYVPLGPTRPRNGAEDYGLYVHRSIIEMPSGSWLMTMCGNFAEDNLPPQDSDAEGETTFMQRTFVVQSNDQGRTWHYLSSVAVPKSGDPVGEGFVEPTMTLLDDGRLLCVMRSGHHYPLYASWSSDGGQTWTFPMYTGLDRGCDPCLIKLADGRVALSWGRRYSEGWSLITPEGDHSRFKYPGHGYTNLAISDDGGTTWVNQEIAQGTGWCYSTIFEVEPDVVLVQVDGWYLRVTLAPKGGSGSSATTTTVASPPSGQQFSDVPASSPYYAPIAALTTRGVVSGFPDQTFRPNNGVTRQQFAKMIVKTLGFAVTGREANPFFDVSSGLDPSDPLYPDKYVAVCVVRGITRGTTSSTFAPVDNITRQQVITMVVRGANLSDPPADYTPPFVPSQFYPSEHYFNARKAAYVHLFDGLVGIGPSYAFASPTTRGEACVLLYNLLRR